MEKYIFLWKTIHIKLKILCYTAIFTIGYNGVLGWTLYEKSGINSQRLKIFLKQNLTSKYKNKVIILDNAISHRNELIRNLVNKDNKLIYSVPYQHFIASSMRIYALLGLQMQ